MIPRNVPFTIEHIDPTTLISFNEDHGISMDCETVEHYRDILLSHPNYDTDPIVVMVDRHGRKRVRNGRHRTLANILAGREYIVAVVYKEQE